MKKLALLFLALVLLSSAPLQPLTGFCEGWEKGYVAGWCYKRQNCYEPYIPYCPRPDYNEDNYEGGYNRAFLTALEDRD